MMKDIHYKWSKLIAVKLYGRSTAVFTPLELHELLEDIKQKCEQANVIRSLPPIYELFKDWCKETNRNGGVIIGSSIREFCTWCDLKLNESCGGDAV